MRWATLVAVLALWLACGARPATAQTLTTFDEHGYRVDALRGVVVWAQDRGLGKQVLMRRIDGRSSVIPGTRRFTNVHDLDLGLDRAGRVALVFDRCHGGRCSGPYVVDVRRGRPRPLGLPRRRGCERGLNASVWREHVAWVRELVGDFGGGESELVAAAVDADCTVRPLGVLPLSALSQPPFASSLAIDGSTMFLEILDGGVLSGPLPAIPRYDPTAPPTAPAPAPW